MSIDLNDPRLTAYALGELDAAEAAEIEQAVRASAELLQAVEDIRATGDMLTAALQDDAMPSLTEQQRTTISNPVAFGKRGLKLFSLRVRPIVLVPASFAAVLMFAWLSLPSLSRSREISEAIDATFNSRKDLGDAKNDAERGGYYEEIFDAGTPRGQHPTGSHANNSQTVGHDQHMPQRPRSAAGNSRRRGGSGDAPELLFALGIDNFAFTAGSNSPRIDINESYGGGGAGGGGGGGGALRDSRSSMGRNLAGRGTEGIAPPAFSRMPPARLDTVRSAQVTVGQAETGRFLRQQSGFGYIGGDENIFDAQLHIYAEQVNALEQQTAELGRLASVYDGSGDPVPTSEDWQLVDQYPLIAQVRSSLSSMDNELQTLRAEFGDDHPEQAAIQDHRAESDQLLGELRDQRMAEILTYRREQVQTAFLNSEQALLLARERLAEAYADVANRERLQESYEGWYGNPFNVTLDTPLSTFAVDVDTASYTNLRRMLSEGRLPPWPSVRIEEMINYFDYDYPQPTIEDPFSVNVDVAECPWHVDHLLARVGLQGYDVPFEDRPAANLVFLIDVSGSMNSPTKLPLLKDAMAMLAGELHDDDIVSIVTYASEANVALEATYGRVERKIVDAVDRLEAEGSTNGESGIHLAYDLADAGFIEGGINRVILATDGDFNVGVSDRGGLQTLIEDKAKLGIFLTVLGFGSGNLKDDTLETLADKGNGHYAYIDSLREAEKVLVDQVGGTLLTIAKDVKVQVEFNPATIAGYRLIGYENRKLAARDFAEDTKDAGEIGAGHSVTALYELVPMGVDVEQIEPVHGDGMIANASAAIDAIDDGQIPSVYANAHDDANAAAFADEFMTVSLRYKEPEGDKSRLIRKAVPATYDRLDDASDDFLFAASVASFGMLLRNSPYISEWTYADTLHLAEMGIGEDPDDDRAEYIDLVEKAEALSVAMPSAGQPSSQP